MLLVIPVSAADKNLIPTVKKAFSILPPGEGHELLVVGTVHVEEEVIDLKQSLAPHFGNSATLIVDNPQPLGWPREGNFLFQQTALYVINHYDPSRHFFWLELDCTPLKANWLSLLAGEFHTELEVATRESRVMPRYMGNKVRTLETVMGELAPVSEAGYHMASCGIYPNNIIASVTTIQAVASAGVPFSEFIQWYVTPELYATTSILDNWRTKNYTKGLGSIHSENQSEHAFGIQFNEPIEIPFNHVLVHGCKDGSLLEVIQKLGDLKEVAPVAQKVTYALPEETFTPAIPYQPVSAATAHMGSYSAPPLPSIAQMTPPPPSAQVIHQSESPLIISTKKDEDIYRMPEGEKPFNGYAVANEHEGEQGPIPELIAPRELPVEEVPAISIPKATYIDDDLVEIPEELTGQQSVLLNNTQQEVAPVTQKRTRGRKMRKTRNFTPEQRKAAGDRMRALAIKRVADRKQRELEAVAA